MCGSSFLWCTCFFVDFVGSEVKLQTILDKVSKQKCVILMKFGPCSEISQGSPSAPNLLSNGQYVPHKVFDRYVRSEEELIEIVRSKISKRKRQKIRALKCTVPLSQCFGKSICRENVRPVQHPIAQRLYITGNNNPPDQRWAFQIQFLKTNEVRLRDRKNKHFCNFTMFRSQQ